MKKLWKENTWFRNICIFLLGMFVGICLMVALYSFTSIFKMIGEINEQVDGLPAVNTQQEAENDSDISDGDVDRNGQEPTETEVPENEEDTTSVYTGNYSEWNAGTVYNSGDVVVFNNRIYKAKWWTQGEEPGSNAVWEDTKETPGEVLQEQDSFADKEVNVVNTKAIADEDFKVVVYYPSWEPYETDKIDYTIVTHVNYAFAIPQTDGTLRNLESPDTAKFIIEEAHANNRKVLLAVGGWSYNDVPLESTFVEATNSSDKVKKFGDNIIQMCNDYGFDGVDIDWEHPRVDGNTSKQYEELMLYLAEKLHAQGKLLTSAVLSGATADGNIYYDAAAHTDAVLNAVDWVNIMAYDGGDGERHSSYEFAVNSGNYWLQNRKMPASKVVLGVPFYARPSWAAYEDILQADKEAYSKDVATFNGMEAHYNGIDTIKAKTDYAIQNFGGIMVWEITQDTSDKKYSLLNAIGEAIKK